MFKVSEIKKFFYILRSQGLIAALNEARIHSVTLIYGRLGIRRNLMLYLNAGRGTFFSALYKNLYTYMLENEIGEGIEVMYEHWYNLIILDAYRSDYFRKYSQLEGELTEVVSKGDFSPEFISKNFRGEFWDTVVVTANVFYHISPFINDDTFFKMVFPERNEKSKHRLVTEAAAEENKNYPNKRLIVHYMSPHDPFEGALADNLVEPPWQGMYQMFRCGKINKKILRNSYIETIREIELEVQKLLPELEGKTVITSDHGENLAEKQHGLTLLGHGHPSKECRMVPWLEIDHNERKILRADEPKPNKKLNEIELIKRLEYFGYA